MSYDDEQIGRLVRDVADEWTMPPTRLDQPTWRDRVGTSQRDANPFRLRPWLRPVGRAAGLAIALLVGVAVLGVVLNTTAPSGSAAPHPSNLAAASPTTSSTPMTTVVPTSAPTELPITAGKLPTVTRAIVQLQNGTLSGYALLDLATGKVGHPIAQQDPDSRVWIDAPSGDLLCVCIAGSGSASIRPIHAVVTYDRYGPDGTLLSSKPIGSYDGAPDPRDSAGIPENPDNLRVRVSVAGSGLMFVGWSVRQHPVWKTGIVMINPQTGEVLSSLDLPDVTDGDGDTRRATDAPVVSGVAGDELVIDRSFYTWTPPDSTQPRIQTGVDGFTATLQGTTLGTAEAIAQGDCGDVVVDAGATVDGGIWLACTSGGDVATVRRISSDGSLIGDTTALTLSEIDGSTMAVSPDGSKVYVWHPIERTLTRIDTSTGTHDDVRAADPSALASPDLLGQLGQWLVPSTEAKMFLQSGVALSPDGSTLYALGVTAFDGRGDAGSTGIYAVKLGATMEIDDWSPAADLVSIAVSNDGSYVYAAGAPGVDSNGDATGQPASVSVYDVATGAVTYTAGQLGDSLLTFAGRLLN